MVADYVPGPRWGGELPAQRARNSAISQLPLVPHAVQRETLRRRCVTPVAYLLLQGVYCFREPRNLGPGPAAHHNSASKTRVNALMVLRCAWDTSQGWGGVYAAFFSRSCFHWPVAARLFIAARCAKARCALATFSVFPAQAFCGAACSARP